MVGKEEIAQMGWKINTPHLNNALRPEADGKSVKSAPKKGRPAFLKEENDT